MDESDSHESPLGLFRHLLTLVSKAQLMNKNPVTLEAGSFHSAGAIV